jgi:asparagine synthase (glutamine-hydrolysing)
MFLSQSFLHEARDYDPIEDAASRIPPDFAERTPMAQAQALEIDVFLSGYLLSSQGDRVAMAHSVEGRFPFLDHRLIEFAFRLPDHWKLRGLDEKHILKRLGEKYIPESIRTRPKQPYRAPIKEAFGGERHAEFLHEAVVDREVSEAGIFDPRKVALLRDRLREGRSLSEVQSMAVMAILTAQFLHRRFVARFPTDIEPREPDLVVRRAGAPKPRGRPQEPSP